MADHHYRVDGESLEVKRLSKDLPFPPDFSRAFGELMIEFASLEGDLFGLTVDLATDNYFHGAILLAGVAYTGLVDRFCALLLHITRGDSVMPERINELRRRMLDVSERRNRLVHSEWMLEPESGSMSRLKASARGKNGLHFDTPDVPVSELTILASDIRDVRRQVAEVASLVFDKYVRRRELGGGSE